MLCCSFCVCDGTRTTTASISTPKGAARPNTTIMLIQQKPVLRINPTLGKSMNPGAIKIIWFERARRTGAVQRICTAPRSIPVEQEQDSVLRKGEMSIPQKKSIGGRYRWVKKSCHFAHAHWGSIGKRYNNKGQHPASRSQSQSFCPNRRF